MNMQVSDCSEGVAVPKIYGFGCFVTLAWMALAEQFQDLPAAAVAFGSGWYLIRLDARQPR